MNAVDFFPINFLYCIHWQFNSIRSKCNVNISRFFRLLFDPVFNNITGTYKVSSLRLSVALYFILSKMSEHAVSDDRWKCGRSSNKACGINRNEGWFFIDGCFSRCRREEDCLGSLSIHEVVRGFFLAVYHTGDTWWFILQRVEKAQSNIILPCAPFSHIKFIIKRKKSLGENLGHRKIYLHAFLYGK